MKAKEKIVQIAAVPCGSAPSGVPGETYMNRLELFALTDRGRLLSNYKGKWKDITPDLTKI